MIERVIHRLLETKIQEIADDLTKLRVFLRANNIVSDEEDKLVEAFRQTPLSVYQDLARAHQKFPNICIVLGQESEYDPRGTFLNDFGEFIDSETAAALEYAGAEGDPVYSSIYSREYHLHVHAQHPDMAIVGYELAKLLLSLARPLFNEMGVLNTQLAGRGLEPIPMSESGGDFIFRRVLVFRALEASSIIDLTSTFGTFTSIAGLHVAGGSTSDVGNARTLVTPVEAL